MARSPSPSALRCSPSPCSSDRSDPERKTHRADIAFWLHLQAAALAANGMLGGVLAGGLHEKMSTGAAALTLIVATLFTLVAIIIDRRALIVSSLAYVGAALMLLIKDDPKQDGSFIFIVMLLGAAVLALSVGWRPIRQAPARNPSAGCIGSASAAGPC